MNPTPSTPPTPLRNAGAMALVVLVVAWLAVLHLPYPFAEDQATFAWGGKALTQGALMYRDFWDMKQPGIYWWYAVGGSLFGFEPLGIRWLDLCWSLAVAWVLWATLRRRGILAAVLGPCLAFGAFYAKVNHFHLTQVEWLISGPVAVVLWCLTRPAQDGDARHVVGRHVLAGVMVTVVGIFKSVEALLPLSMLAVAMAHSHWQEGRGWREVWRQQALPAALGVVVLALPIALWMQWNGTLQGVLWTTFGYPTEAVREYGRQPLWKLHWSFTGFRQGNIWLAPWALWAVYNGLRHRRLMELLCTAWGLSAAFVIAVQVLSYWQYHFDMLFMPLGVLAALGFVDVLERLRRRGAKAPQAIAMVLMALSVLACMARPLFEKTERFARAVPFTPDRLLAFNDALDDRFASYRLAMEAIRPLSAPSDPIMVFGDQRLYAFANRRPILQVNGNTMYLARELPQVVATIRTVQPALIYLGKQRDSLTNHGGGVLPKVVDELYARCYDDRWGTWYCLRSRRGSPS